mmetsp:Transcript_52110/g.118799  ORF Transcript_52110/g.118799 Transcript_52110/m.118799 type:complete len:237 (-) Transcript_52110:264-974(-)
MGGDPRAARSITSCPGRRPRTAVWNSSRVMAPFMFLSRLWRKALACSGSMTTPKAPSAVTSSPASMLLLPSKSNALKSASTDWFQRLKSFCALATTLAHASSLRSSCDLCSESWLSRSSLMRCFSSPSVNSLIEIRKSPSSSMSSLKAISCSGLISMPKVLRPAANSDTSMREEPSRSKLAKSMATDLSHASRSRSATVRINSHALNNTWSYSARISGSKRSTTAVIPSYPRRRCR